MELERIRHNFATIRVSLAVARKFVARLLLACIIRILPQNVIDDFHVARVTRKVSAEFSSGLSSSLNSLSLLWRVC
jgi:hypothetical protein